MLLHIISKADLERANVSGEISPPSLESEGFVHCSYPDQVLIPANERFRGQDDLVLVVLDPRRIGAPVVVEDSYGSGAAFPHAYGPIPLTAVVRLIDFPPRPDGSFDLPPVLRSDTW